MSPTPISVAVPDGRIAASEVGDGPAVVLVHGGTSTGDQEWSGIRVHLARTRRVVTVDLRGHGASSNLGGELSTRRFAADLPHVVRRLGVGQADYVGFSLGANTVLELLCRRPELASSAVLVGGSATGHPERVRRLSASPAWPAALRGLRHAVDPSPDYWLHLRTALLADWAANTEVEQRLLDRIRRPVLVVNGCDDPIQRPAVARHLADALPDARLSLVPEAGHAVHLDQPRRFCCLLDSFLTAIGPRRAT